ncbi:MAG: hypothetical protein L0I79_03225, partial [Atopostipes sp.]|nr:hypothetical protein [Atopostipes sp.]
SFNIGDMNVQQSSWKFFVGIGVLLIIAGAYIFPVDNIIGIIGLLFGAYNVYKGIRLARGKQPYLIRKQRESLEKTEKDLEDKKKK